MATHALFNYLGTANDLGQIGAFLTGVAALIGVMALSFNWAQNRRDTIRLKAEQWRISYQNLNIVAKHQLTHTANVLAAGVAGLHAHRGPGDATPDTSLTQFSVFRLEVHNIGDGPVDVWGCLVAARELNGGDHRESWGGNIEWNDLDPYYFDTEVKEFEPLAGISNTRHCVYSQDDYVTLDPKEVDTLTRIDRIEPVSAYHTLLYRVFLVGRGYGGTKSKLARPDFLAWQRLQQALFNISGPSFRILFDLEDPLDLVADRDGWQCFMLYHRAFTDDRRDAHGWTYIDQLNNRLEGSWGASVSEADARATCRNELDSVCVQWSRHWEAFQQAVARCKELPNGFADLLNDKQWRPKVSGPPMHDRHNDLTLLSVREAFSRLPTYLRWDPAVDDTLPVWEKFFLVTLTPEGVPQRVSQAEAHSAAQRETLGQLAGVAPPTRFVSNV